MTAEIGNREVMGHIDKRVFRGALRTRERGRTEVETTLNSWQVEIIPVT